MKKTTNTIIILLLLVGCFFSVSTVALAETSATSETSETSNSLPRLPSKFIAEPKIDIEAVIKDKVTEERVNERYDVSFLDMPEKFTYDTSTYLVEYSVDTDYWDNVKTLDYKGLTEAIYPSYPTIYIPIWADVSDPNGSISARVVAYIQLYHDVLDGYRFSLQVHNIATPEYFDKSVVDYYEDLLFYLEESNTDAKQVFLINYPSSLTYRKEKIAIIQTESDSVVLDLFNTLKIDNGNKESDRSLVYSIAEYKPLRQELEKELYQTVSSWEEVRFGGDVNDQPNDEKNTWIIFIPSIIAIMVALGTVIYFVLKKHRKHPSN